MVSNTCSVANCRNDRRYPKRFVVMPHVWEFKFHHPRPEEYLEWQKKLNRRGYKVSRCTSICSNHFRYGRPLEQSRKPVLYLHEYPEWALKVGQLSEQAQESSDDIVCPLLAHMVQYLHPKLTRVVIDKYSLNELSPDCSVENLCQYVLHMSECKAREMMSYITAVVCPGKVQEALAIHCSGIPISDTCGVTSNTADLSLQMKECSSSLSVARFHNYAAAPKAKIQKKAPRVTFHSSVSGLYFKNLHSLETKVRQLTEEMTGLKKDKQTLLLKNEYLMKQLADAKNRIRTLEANSSNRLLLFVKPSRDSDKPAA